MGIKSWRQQSKKQKVVRGALGVTAGEQRDFGGSRQILLEAPATSNTPPLSSAGHPGAGDIFLLFLAFLP